MPNADILLSDDFKNLTVFKEDDEGIKEEGDGTSQDPSVSTDDLLNMDVSKLPEEHQDNIKHLLGTVKDQIAQIGTLQNKVDTSEILLQNLRQPDTQEPVGKVEDKVSQEKLADGMKFDKDDYYAEHFKSLAGAIDLMANRIENLTTQTEIDKRVTFESGVKDFLVTNKVAPEVVARMDAIARDFGTQVYKNLPKLLKTAKLELGVKDNETKTTQPGAKDKTKPPTKKRTIDSGGMKKTVTEPRKIDSMADAFEQAQEDLADVD